MSIASAAWPAIESAVSAISPATGRPGCSETIVSVASSSAGVAIGITAAVEPLRRNGASRASAPPSASAAVGVEEERLVALEQLEQMPSRQLLRPREERARRRVDALVVDVHGPRDELDPALVGHPDHGGIDTEQRHDRLREHVERRLEREALREGARDLVQRVEPLGRLALRRERLLALAAQLLRALVQPRVLDQHGELRGERDEQRALVGAQRPRLPRVDGEHADRLVADDERQRERRVDARLAHLGSRGLEPLVGGRVVDLDDRSALPRTRARPRAARRRSPRADPRCPCSRRRRSARPRGDRRRRGRSRAAPRPARSRCRACARATGARSPRRPRPAARGFARARRPVSRARSEERSACAARTAKLASWARPCSSGARPGAKPELQRAERRLAELKRDGVALRWPPLAAARPRAFPAPRRTAARRASSSRSGSIGPCAPSTSSAPARRRQTSARFGSRRRARRGARNAPRRALVVGDGGKRVAGDVERAGALPCPTRRVVAEPGRERGQVGRERATSCASSVERPTAASELEHRRVAASAVERNVEHADVTLDSARGRARRPSRPTRSGAPRARRRGSRTTPTQPRDQRAGAVGKPDGRQSQRRCRARRPRRARRGSARAAPPPASARLARESAASASDTSVRVVDHDA